MVKKAVFLAMMLAATSLAVSVGARNPGKNASGLRLKAAGGFGQRTLAGTGIGMHRHKKAGEKGALVRGVKPAGQALAPGALNVLLLGSDDCAGPLQSGLLGFPDVASADFWDFKYTPTLGLLQSYDVVICWTNYPPEYYDGDPNSAGDLLADYVDGGGKLIISTFGYSGPSWWGLGGRVMTDAYTPLLYGNYNHYSWANLGTYNASHQIMQGVTAVGDFYRDFTTLSTGADLVASWDDGENLAATKNCIVGINLYPGCYYNFTGDVVLLYHNAVDFLSNGCMGGGINLNLYDDVQPGAAQFCVNTASGLYEWDNYNYFLSYNGRAEVNNGGAAIWNGPTDPNFLYVVYNPVQMNAYGYFYDTGNGLFSSFADYDTTDTPFPCGGGGQPRVRR